MTAIEWTDRTWNPIVGCSRVSEGCVHCYAERFVHRELAPQHRGLTVIRQGRAGWTGEVRLVESRLGAPLKWRKPQRVFVNSLSDLFHEQLSNEAIAAVFGIMAACPHLTFQVLTKRPARMLSWFRWAAAGALDRCACCADDALEKTFSRSDRASLFAPGRGARRWPLEHVELGVSVEHQAAADERIPILLETPAAHRWVSYEPALGPVDWRRVGDPWQDVLRFGAPPQSDGWVRGLDWIVVGGESGAGARPFDLAWARSTISQCQAAGVPVFVKQLGAYPVDARETVGESVEPHVVLHHSKGGDPSEWPPELRVRELPRGAP